MSGMVKGRRVVDGATTPGGTKPWLRSRLTAFCAKGALTAGSPSRRGCRSRRCAPSARVISGMRAGYARPGPTPAATTRPGRQDRPDGAVNGDRRALTRRYPYHVPIAHWQTWKVHRRDIAPAGGNPAIAGPVRPTRNRHHRHTAQEQEILYALRLGQDRRSIRKSRRRHKKLRLPHNGVRQRRPSQTVARRSGTTGRADGAGAGQAQPKPPSTGMTRAE